MKKEDKQKMKEVNKEINKKVNKGISEFKEFITKGNVVDLAVGVIVGGAFSKIVTSLVNDILMPIIGILIGGMNFNNLSIKIADAKIMYGSFIQQVIDFLIISLSIFIFVKIINKITKKKDEIEEKLREEIKVEEIAEKEEKLEEVVEEVKKSEEVMLLEEIRDLLKEKEMSK